MKDSIKISNFSERQKSSIKNMKFGEQEKALIWREESCFFLIFICDCDFDLLA